MKSFKKITATALALTMITASSLTAFAAEEGELPENPAGDEETVGDPTEGNLGGNGTVEGVVKKDVFKVVLPTIDSDNDKTFDYKMDPQGLIKATSAAAYGEGYTFADGASVFFQNKEKEYSATSNALTITNKSTMKVNVTLTATVDEVSGLTMADSATFAADDTATKLYLALIGGEGESAQTKAVTTSGVTITTEMAAAPAEAYAAAYVDGEYVYALTDAAKAEGYTGFATYSFKLTGACNTNKDADWTELKEANPRVDVVWTVEDPTADNGILDGATLKGSIYEADFTKGTAKVLTVADDAKVKSATWGSSADDITKTSTSITVSGSKVTIASGMWATIEAGGVKYLKITLDDGTALTVKFTIQ